jgi:phospholipase C
MPQNILWKFHADRIRNRWLISVTRSCTAWANTGIQRGQSWAENARHNWHGPAWIGAALIGIAQYSASAGYFTVKLLGLLFANLVNLAWIAAIAIAWLPFLLFFRRKPASGPIKHIFVVMLENRSFDHMLGLSNIQGNDAISSLPTAIDGLNATNNSNSDANSHAFHTYAPASWAMPFDPPHEFNDVQEQLCGLGGTYEAIKEKNGGFVTRYSHRDAAHPGEIMQCYAPDQLPILTTLAKEFAVCDRWHASLPGPTWPNRFFIHAASSGGLDDSPIGLPLVGAALFNGYKFDNGTIYDCLDDAGLAWRIYHDDAFPQALAISGMQANLLQGRFEKFAEFSQQVNDPNYAPVYTFIEPNYGHAFTYGRDFTCGNSQHPKDDVTSGEKFLKAIYETIRNSPHWNDSLLIITYDEHGGFYDHVFPPATVAPGDSVTDTENNHHNFDFKLLGVRVPAVIISPLIPKGTIDHTLYDHTSALATVEHLFGIQPLTKRDQEANTLTHLLSLRKPRTDTPSTLPAAASSGIVCDELTAELTRDASNLEAPLDNALKGFLHVAFLRDQQVSTTLEEKQQRLAQYQQITTQGAALAYMDEVRQRIAARQPSSK